MGHRVPKRSELSALPERQGKLRRAQFFLGSSLDEARSARRATLVAGRGRAAGGLRVKPMWRLRKHPHLPRTSGGRPADYIDHYLYRIWRTCLVPFICKFAFLPASSTFYRIPAADTVAHDMLEA